MGEPAQMTPDEQTSALQLATAMVDAVRNDGEGPFALPDLSHASSRKDVIDTFTRWWAGIDLQAFYLAQYSVNLRRALDLACERLAAAGTPADRELAAKLRVLDLPPPAASDEAAAQARVVRPAIYTENMAAPVSRSGRDRGSKVPPLPKPPAKVG